MEEYIQLPPLPADLECDAVKVIWEYAKLSEEEKVNVYDDMCRILGNKEEISEIPKEYRKIELEEISDYVEALRCLMASLIVEASDIVAWVFVRKYIEGVTLEQMLEEMTHAENFIRAIDIMFEKNIGIKEDDGYHTREEN